MVVDTDLATEYQHARDALALTDAEPAGVARGQWLSDEADPPGRRAR